MHPLVAQLQPTLADHPVGAARSLDAVRSELATLIAALGPDADHAQRVQTLSVAMGRSLRLPPEALRALSLGSALHDVGKLSIPRAILEKAGRLSASDWAVVRRHPAEGETMVSRLVDAPEVLSIIRSHHERWDGMGYPDGLTREQIPIGARIVAVSDAFQAMTETRAYRPALSKSSALDELHAHARTQFDPVCVGVLRAVVADESPKAASRPVVMTKAMAWAALGGRR